MTDPPDPYFGMDVIWPGKSRDLGSTISYACPFRTGTHEAELKCMIFPSFCSCLSLFISSVNLFHSPIHSLQMGQGHRQYGMVATLFGYMQP